MTDYSKWDAMARDEDAAEAREKELKRQQNRENYYKQQEEKKRKYEVDQAAKGVATGGHSHDHGTHGHSHGHSHDHNAPGHSHGSGDASHEHTHSSQQQFEPIRRPACGCGYADVNELKAAAAAAASAPQISAAEKLAKKISAVHATREHGKILYTEGKYAEAFAVYERGVLILSGIFGVSDKEQDELTETEVILDLNMAMCKIKLSEWKAAIDQCRMALQLDPKNVKAHFRWGMACIGLGEFDDARTHFAKATELDTTGSCKREIQAQLNEIKRLQVQEREKQIKFTKQLEQKMQKEKIMQGGLTQEEEKESKSA